MENVLCPNCKNPKYYYKYINCKEITICSLCGYWDYFICDDELGLLDLPENPSVDEDC